MTQSLIVGELPMKTFFSTQIAVCLFLVVVQGLASDEKPKTKTPSLKADVIIQNGRIWTVNKKRPEAEALAIARHRIVAVGSNTDIQPLIGPKTKIIDGQKRRVL